MVPRKVKESISKLHAIVTDNELSDQYWKESLIFHRANDQAGASKNEILDWFGNCKDKILRFRFLYHAFSQFSEREENLNFEEDVAVGLTSASYRQYAN